MKKLMAGLKPKEFLLNHGEKLGFGLALLIVVVSLTRSEWSRYAKTPQEIIAAVQKSKAAIDASVWPPEKKTAFGLQDYDGRKQDVRGPLQLGRHEFSTNMWWPLYRKQELRKEPELLAVTDLIAKPGIMAFGTVPKPETGDLVAAADGEAMEAKTVGDDVDTDFTPTAKAAATGIGSEGAFGPPGGSFGPGGGHSGGGGRSAPAGSPAGPAGGHGGAGGAMAEAAYNPYGLSGEDGMMGGMAGPAMSSRGERFVAVRGIWPLYAQQEKLQRALNLQSISDAYNYIQLLDFVLERQTAVPGADPWTGPWDVVDSQRAIDLLSEAYDFAPDPVDPMITDVTITMPLPARLVGQWGDLATHPKIEKYVLPKEEQERQRRLEEKINEEYEKYRLKEETRNVKPKGFSKVQRNMRSMAEQMFTGDYGSQIEQEMGSWGTTDAVMRMSAPDMKKRAMAVGRLILFRYFDFDVRPGYAYRYRVKLKLRNPNFELPPEQVIDASVAEGVDRETPYSNISNVSVVPESVDFFVKEVDRDPVNDPRSSGSKPLARLDFFEWDAAVGTMIRDTVELTSFGQFIQEEKKSLRLDVAVPSLKDTKVVFRSDDLLLDAVGDPKLDAEIHKDLKLPPAFRGKAGLPGEMLVMDEGGQLRTLDPSTNQSRRTELMRYVERERAPFKHLENQEPKPTGMLEGGNYPGAEGSGAMMEMGSGMEMYPGMMKKGKKKNPRKASAMGSSSMMGP